MLKKSFLVMSLVAFSFSLVQADNAAELSTVQFPKTRAEYLKKSEAKIQATFDKFKQKTGIDLLELSQEDESFRDLHSKTKDISSIEELGNLKEETDSGRINLIQNCLMLEGLDKDILKVYYSDCDDSDDAMSLEVKLEVKSVYQHEDVLILEGSFWDKSEDYIRAHIHHVISHIKHRSNGTIELAKAFKNHKCFKSEHANDLQKLENKLTKICTHRADMEAVTYSSSNATILRDDYLEEEVFELLCLACEEEGPYIDEIDKLLEEESDEIDDKVYKIIKQRFPEYSLSNYKAIKAIENVMLECEQEAKE
jgi:hypothetical protein